MWIVTLVTRSQKVQFTRPAFHLNHTDKYESDKLAFGAKVAIIFIIMLFIASTDVNVFSVNLFFS